MLHAVIMAGGGGTRLWPLSTPARPKQFLSLTGQDSLIEATMRRVASMTTPQTRWVVTLEQQAHLLDAAALEIEPKNILREPLGRNTAPCIALAARLIVEQDPDAVMVVLPADHDVEGDEEFKGTLGLAVEAAQKYDSLLTLGIRPDRAETGYGYIEFGEETELSGVHRVEAFREKPDLPTAERYVAGGRHLWNSGMFIWRAERVLRAFAEHTPLLHNALDELAQVAQDPDRSGRFFELYEALEKISIDYGVMEPETDILVVPSSFSWSDVGGYEELYKRAEQSEEGTAAIGPVYQQDVRSSYLRSEDGRPLAVIGMSGVVVVSSDEGVLVCPRDRLGEVRDASGWAAKLARAAEREGE